MRLHLGVAPLGLALSGLALVANAAPALGQEAASELAPPTETEVAPADVRSVPLGMLRAGRPDRGFGEPIAGWVSESVFGGDYDGGSATVLATDLGLRLALGDGARVRASWGVAWSRSRVVGTFTTATTTTPYDVTLERVEARNADFSLEWAPWVGTSTRILLGVGTALPLAAVATFGSALSTGASTPAQAAILDAATQTHAIWLAMNGAWAPWRYQPERIAVFAPLGAYFDAGAVVVGVEVAFAASFPVLGGSGGPEGALGLALEVSGRPVEMLTLGARASLSAYSLGGRGEAAQPAVEPFLRFDVAPVSISLAGVIDIGWAARPGSMTPPPFGVGTPNGVWAVSLGVAVHMDPEGEP